VYIGEKVEGEKGERTRVGQRLMRHSVQLSNSRLGPLTDSSSSSSSPPDRLMLPPCHAATTPYGPRGRHVV
jgi:hypothetical protein